jgi:hypothetical protein
MKHQLLKLEPTRETIIMKQFRLLPTVKQVLPLVAATLLMAVTSVLSAAEQAQGAKGSQVNSPSATRPNIIYKAPLFDTPTPAVSQNTRSVKNETCLLQVLAPDHTGLTLQPQPALYWYTSTAVALRFTIAAIDQKKTAPLLQIDINKATGIQKLDLGKHGITLQPELNYQWSVTQVMGNKEQSAAVASGIIQRIEAGEGLNSRVKKNHGTKLVNVYAIEGIWYDALDTISSMIDKSPEDKTLVAIRTSLLKQIGLHIAEN